MGEQRIGLEHHIDRALVWRHVRHVLTVEDNLPFRRLFKTGQHAQQRRFSTARRPQQRKDFALVDRQADVFYRILAVKGFGEVTDFQQRGEHLLRFG